MKLLALILAIVATAAMLINCSSRKTKPESSKKPVASSSPAPFGDGKVKDPFEDKKANDNKPTPGQGNTGNGNNQGNGSGNNNGSSNQNNQGEETDVTVDYEIQL